MKKIMTAAVLKGCAFAILAFLTPMRAKDIQIFTEENKPLNFSSPSKEVTGFSSEVVREIQKRIGDKSTITLGPWASAYQTVQTTPDTMLYSTMRTEEREKLFKWVGPLTVVRTSFYGSKTLGKFGTLEEAKKAAKITLPNKYYTDQFLVAEGFKNLDRVESPTAMIQKFNAGETAVFTSSDFALPLLLDNNQVPIEKVALLLTYMETSHYLAFSPRTSDDVIVKWQGALDEMKKDGSFARLHGKWLSGKKMPK
jgi:polar amino acid transport system substrate-binding protein